MTSRTPIDPKVRRRIKDELMRIEREHDVRIIFAVESGSRAWGFPSPNSDHDARFVYVRPMEAYLSVAPPRDVIEEPPGDVLDLNGWDIWKALQLMCRSNAVLMEWLTSPIRYRWVGQWPARLLNLARKTCHLPALAYHYDRLARRNFDEIEGADTVRIKRYFYALRPAAALLWIRHHREAPPMDLNSLLAGIKIPPGVRAAIERLVEEKAQALESHRIARIAMLDRFIAGVLAIDVPRPTGPTSQAEAVDQANRFLIKLVRTVRG